MIEESNVTSNAADGQPQGSLRWLAWVAMVMAIVGSVLFAVGYSMPAYTDPVAAERIRSGEECERGIPNMNENRQCDSALWYDSMNALRTNKWGLVDGGAGLLASGLTTGVFFWWNRKKSWRQLSTPKSRLVILALAALAWLIQIPAYQLLFITELTRGYYPHWADSIAIPMMRVSSILLTLFLPYMGIWLLFIVGARLPAIVFSTVPGRSLLNIVWTAAAALMFAPVALVLAGAVLEGPTMMVPFLWVIFWLTLCARAAALSRHRPGGATKAGPVA